MEKRSWMVTATVIVVAAFIGLGAGVTTALVSRDDPAAADSPGGPTTSTSANASDNITIDMALAPCRLADSTSPKT